VVTFDLDGWQKAFAISVAACGWLVIIFGKPIWSALGKWRDGVLEATFGWLSDGSRAKASLAAVDARFDEVLAELKPNGGSSMRDAINRIEELQIRLSVRVDHVLNGQIDTPALYETDQAGLCVWVSPSYSKMTGQPLTEAIGWGWIVPLHPEDSDKVRGEWRLAIEERRSFSMVFRIVTGDGSVVRVYSRAHPLRVGTKIIGWSGTLSNYS
jgi:PAS domain S-box-containing protein